MMFHQKSSCLDLERIPPTSNAINLHIHRAYLQAYIWYHAAIDSTINIDPELYGYACDEDDNLVPIINDACLLPEEFPLPCKCIKCKFEKRCPCRVAELACCQYCKCTNECSNPL